MTTRFKAPFVGLHRDFEKKLAVVNNEVVQKLNYATTNAGASSVVSLTQANFTNGTVLIASDYYVWTAAGVDTKVNGSTKGKIFRLTENVVFNPNPSTGPSHTDQWTKSEPSSSQLVSNGGNYPDDSFGLGFFAAISLFADDVIIDLNGFTLSQGTEHYVQQRFFTLIEIANIPFLPTQGPHKFGSVLIAATNCVIMNGKLGLAAHSGIHGNNNRNCLFKDIIFEKYEISAATVNGSIECYFIDCLAKGHSQNVHVLGTWSAARFIRPYIDYLNTENAAFSITIQNVSQTVATIRTALMGAMATALTDILNNDETTDPVFQNPTKLPEGNSYGFSTFGKGVGVNGFQASRKNLGTGLYFKNCEVHDHIATVQEKLALEVYYAPDATQSVIDATKGQHEKDPRGAVFITQNATTINSSGIYLGNIIADAQAIVAKAIISGDISGPISEGGPGTNGQILSTKRSSISQTTIDWIEQNVGYVPYTERNILFNGDNMHHVNKGIVGFRLDGSDDTVLYQCLVAEIKNKTPTIAKSALNITAWTPVARFEEDYNNYKNRVGKSNIHSTLLGCQNGQVRGFSLSSCGNVYMYKCKVRDLETAFGSCTGIELQQLTTNVYIESCEVISTNAGTAGNLDLYNNNPESMPIGRGLLIQDSVEKAYIESFKSSEIQGLFEADDIAIRSDSVVIQ
jgi:hypothetical protein